LGGSSAPPAAPPFTAPPPATSGPLPAPPAVGTPPVTAPAPAPAVAPSGEPAPAAALPPPGRDVLVPPAASQALASNEIHGGRRRRRIPLRFPARRAPAHDFSDQGSSCAGSQKGRSTCTHVGAASKFASLPEAETSCASEPAPSFNGK